MPAKVSLTVIGGELTGQEHEFAEVSTCIIGRASDCNLRLPNNKAHEQISRHHCLLDMNPPSARLRDFGSLNGTCLNGIRIGRRQKGTNPEGASGIQFPEHELQDGDEIKLGETVFRVDVYAPAFCTECSTEIPDADRARAELSPGVIHCEACRRKAELTKRREPPKRKPRVCAKCGRDVSKEVGHMRPGDYVCGRCRENPLGIIERLLQRAQRGEPEVREIQGYVLESKLGKGGMGEVFLARHERSGEQVALKLMLPKVAADAKAKALFLREVELTKALSHPNIVGFRESGFSNGSFFLTLEFCAGGSVDKLIQRRGGRLSVDEALQAMFDVLDGLDYAHQAYIPKVLLKDGATAEAHGLVDRDLSPHNILLTNSESRVLAKVSDFGLSKAFDTAGLSTGTRTGEVAGKPWFMPRQQVVNYKYAKPDVDIWAAAACLYNMLTGAFPKDFPRGKDPWKIVLDASPVPILQRNPTIPRKLAEVIDHALIEKPQIGFQSASALKAALQGSV